MTQPLLQVRQLGKRFGGFVVLDGIDFHVQPGERVGQCRADEDIMTDLARRLGLPHSEESPRDVFNQQLAPLGITYEELARNGPMQIPMRYDKFHERGFETPTGKIELYSTRLEELGYDPLPYYEEPPESPVSTPEIAREFPYVLTTGARLPMYFHSEGRQIPKLRKGRPEPQVEIHPDTAARHGIAQDDWVRIASPRGSILQRALLTLIAHKVSADLTGIAKIGEALEKLRQWRRQTRETHRMCSGFRSVLNQQIAPVTQ